MMDDLHFQESEYGDDENQSILDSSMFSEIHPPEEELDNTLEILDQSCVGQPQSVYKQESTKNKEESSSYSLNPTQTPVSTTSIKISQPTNLENEIPNTENFPVGSQIEETDKFIRCKSLTFFQ